MDYYVKALARNAAYLLYIPSFSTPVQLKIAENMFKVLIESQSFSKEVIRLLYKNSLKLNAINEDGRRAIKTLRDDLNYLLLLREDN